MAERRPLATPGEVAAYRRTSEAALAQERYRGTGPRFKKLGKRVFTTGSTSKRGSKPTRSSEPTTRAVSPDAYLPGTRRSRPRPRGRPDRRPSARKE